MKLAVYRPLWGVAKQAGGHLSLPDAFRAIAKLGYAGVECTVGLALHYGAQQFKDLLAENKLGWFAAVNSRYFSRALQHIALNI